MAELPSQAAQRRSVEKFRERQLEPPEGLVIHRYEHGGGRVYFERDGKRDLVMDLYDDDPEGKRRDAIIAAVLAAGVLD